MDNKPISPTDFAKEQSPEIQKVLLEFEQVQDAHIRYWRYKACAVCGCELNEREQEAFAVDHFNATCTAHREHANAFNLIWIKAHLGLVACNPTSTIDQNQLGNG